MLDGASRAPTLGLFIPKKQALIFSGLIFNDLRPYGINEGLAGMREIRQRKKKRKEKGLQLLLDKNNWERSLKTDILPVSKIPWLKAQPGLGRRRCATGPYGKVFACDKASSHGLLFR